MKAQNHPEFPGWFFKKLLIIQRQILYDFVVFF